MKSFTYLARKAYAAFYTRANGKTYDGKPLATWEQIPSEQQSCWIEVAKTVAHELQSIH